MTGNTRRTGMSTGKKLIILAGAAALYYMYKKHQQNAQAGAQNVQYYLSKNGGVYYRDPKTHQAIYIKPPAGGIQVPDSEAQQYSQFKGYNNQNQGRDLTGAIPAGPGG